MADSDDKSDKGWPDDGREWRELTDLDRVKGEWIAREMQEKSHEEVEHFKHAHSTDPIDGIMNSIFGTSEECRNPRCDTEERYAKYEAEEQARRESESWWERWSREREEKREERRVFGEIEATQAEEEGSESWWDRWFRGSNNGGDGEGGSD